MSKCIEMLSDASVCSHISIVRLITKQQIYGWSFVDVSITAVVVVL